MRDPQAFDRLRASCRPEFLWELADEGMPIRSMAPANAPTNPDPELSPAGVERAQEIARVFGESGINAIYATQFKRTQQTVKPLADRTKVPVTLLDANQTDELVQRIQTTHRGQTVFVAGHNNSVPAIVSTLSGETYPLIPESEYDNLFIVTIYRFGKAKVVRLRYGKESTQGVGTGTMVPLGK